jgi:hypothetical protein
VTVFAACPWRRRAWRPTCDKSTWPPQFPRTHSVRYRVRWPVHGHSSASAAARAGIERSPIRNAAHRATRSFGGGIPSILARAVEAREGACDSVRRRVLLGNSLKRSGVRNVPDTLGYQKAHRLGRAVDQYNRAARDRCAEGAGRDLSHWPRSPSRNVRLNTEEAFQTSICR